MARIQVPWLRVVAESVAIVFGILLAFSINAWWEDRQNRGEEYQLLDNLRAELRSNLSRIELELSYRDEVVESILKIFEAADGKASIEPQELDTLLGDITWWADADYARGVIEQITQGGKLSLVEGDELRQLLPSLPHLYELTRQIEADDKDITRNVINPFLSANAAFSQIANTLVKGRPGTGELPTEPLYPTVSRRDHSYLLQNEEFQAILVRTHWDHLAAIDFLNALRETLEHGVELIDFRLSELR